MYKKLLLVFVSVITIHTVKAQTEKGSQMLGASFGIGTLKGNFTNYDTYSNTYNTNESKFTNYSFAPSYSYFVADNLDLGASVGYGRNKQGNSGSTITTQSSATNSFSGEVYLRKYFLFESKIGVRTGPYFNYQWSNQTQINPGFTYPDTKNTTYNGGIGLDFVYFPVKRLALAARMGSLNFSHQKLSGGFTEGTANTVNLAFANSLTFSVNYIFGK